MAHSSKTGVINMTQRLIKNVVICFAAATVFACDLFFPSGTNFVNGIAIIETTDDTYPYLIIGENGDMLAPQTNTGGDLDHVVYTTADNKTAVIQTDSNGYPTEIALDTGYVILLENWTTTTVDIAVVDPDGTYEISRGVSLGNDFTYQATGARSRRSDRVSLKQNPPAVQPMAFDNKDWMDLLSTTVKAVSCGVAVLTAPAHAGIGAYFVCGDWLVDVATYLVPEEYETFLQPASVLADGVGAWRTGADCATGDRVNCVLGIVSTGYAVVESLGDSVSDSTNSASGVLASGYGVIQVTLTWDNSSDLDLWVTDPSGERIYYGHRTSASGGYLDYDDTNGFGPENVFWETSAPAGIYVVEIDYYSGSGAAGYDVYVDTSWQLAPTRYQGILYPNETETVVTFLSNGT